MKMALCCEPGDVMRYSMGNTMEDGRIQTMVMVDAPTDRLWVDLAMAKRLLELAEQAETRNRRVFGTATPPPLASP